MYENIYLIVMLACPMIFAVVTLLHAWKQVKGRWMHKNVCLNIQLFVPEYSWDSDHL